MKRPLIYSLGLFAAIAGGRGAEAPAWPPPPGVVIDVSPKPANTFVGSPSIVILPDGSYVASHDFFGPKAEAGLARNTRIFSSHDGGASWRQLAQLPDQTWSTLFVHHGALYLIGAAKEYGNIVIRRSDDGGNTWTTPTDAHTGLLFPGRFHCGPTPVVVHGGRVWRAFEHYSGPDGSWSGRFFSTLMVSAPEDSDLLEAANWTRANEIPFGADWVNGDRPGWLEGNVVVAPDGRMVNILRVEARPSLNDRFPLEGPGAGIFRYEIAAMVEVAADGRSVHFDPHGGFFRFPGSQTKFTIRFDPTTRRYWSLVNPFTNPYAGYADTDYSAEWQRNVVKLTSSPDLRNWTEHYTLLRWREGLPVARFDRVAFQYLDWQFEGNDIIAVARTSWNGNSYHNANYLTFHRLRNFRTLTPADSPPPLEAPVAPPPTRIIR